MKCTCGHSPGEHLPNTALSNAWACKKCLCHEFTGAPPALPERKWCCTRAECPARPAVATATAPRCYTCGDLMVVYEYITITIGHETLWRCLCSGYTRRSAGPPTCYVCGEKMVRSTVEDLVTDVMKMKGDAFSKILDDYISTGWLAIRRNRC